MLGKIVGVLVAIALIVSSVFILYENIPHDPIKMTINHLNQSDPISYVDYGATPVFSENLRFDHSNISYYIESSCPKKRREYMVAAFKIFEEKMDRITFYELKSSEADIRVGCSDNYIEVGENLFAAGEGGPSEIINTSIFKVIKKGKISIYEDPRCDRPIVEIHELGHVFGFDHTPNEKSIMYNISRCDQKITPDMIELIDKLYKIPSNPEVTISNLSAVKKGKYLDFNITILNEGLDDAKNVTLQILSEGELVEETSIGRINIGYGRTLKAQNILLNSRKTETVDFKIRLEENQEELNADNNIETMKVQSQ